MIDRAAAAGPSLRDPRWIPRLILTLLVFPFLTVACDLGLGAANRDTPPTDGAAQPRDVLRIGQDTSAGGWVVLPEWSGVWVAGGGTLVDIDQKTGEARQTGHGRWDYDYVELARHGEGTIFLASGRTLWQVDAQSGSIIQRLDLRHLGYVDSVLDTRSGTWVTASTEDGGVLARIDLDTGGAMDQIRIGQGRHELVKSVGYLVVASQDPSAGIIRVDPRTGMKVTLHEGTGSIASVGYRIWIAADDGVRCLDVLELTSCGEVRIDRAVSVVSDGARLWVLTATGSTSPSTYEPDPSQPATVILVDGVNGEVVAGPLALPSITPATISAFEGRAWIGFHDEGRVIRIDCGDGRCSVPGWGPDQST
jgi:hypothetical protein